MLQKREIEKFYKDVVDLGLRFPVADIAKATSKNKKDDYVPLSSYILTNYRPVSGQSLIFGTNVNYFGQKWTELKRELKLDDDYTLYGFKHSRAIHLAQDGADPFIIMQLFRHSNLGVTQSYLRDLGVNINREAVEKGIRF